MTQPLITRPGYGEGHPALPKATSNEPSKAQLDYAKHLVKQVGGEEPDWSKMNSVEVSSLIDGLKKKRGKPVWYGNGQFSHWEKSARPLLDPMGTAELPTGGPVDRGISIDPKDTGQSTFNKPVDDHREFDKSPPGSIYKKDGPDDRAKPQEDPEDDQRPHEDFKPRITDPGGHPSEDDSITRYPYRDDKPNTHNASALLVAGMFLLDRAPVLFLPGEAKVAAEIEEIEQKLSPRINQRSKQCRSTLRRADVKNLRWIFSVDCGNGPKVVRLKANRTGNIVKFTKLNLQLACSCPAWRWQGPEFHAQQQDYQDPKTPLQGTASAPNIRDPRRVNKVCKHVAAVLAMTRSWTIPIRAK